MLRTRTDSLVWFALSFLTGALVANFIFNQATYGWVELVGFTTGAFCVWLAVKESTWNFPIGLVNSGAFIWLFLDFKLYADFAINVVFVLLGLYGWWNWKFGGKGRTVLPVRRAQGFELVAGVGAVIILTGLIEPLLRDIQDIAPWRDAVTFALSIVAQYFLDRKVFANWGFWIVADLIYIPLYFQKSLVLTGFVYCLFLLMCVRAVFEWRPALVEAELQDILLEPVKV